MDNKTIKERLLEFIAYKNLNVSKFEKLCGMSNGYVRSVERVIGEDKIANIRNAFPDLSIPWLILGEGEMFSSHSVQEVTPDGELIKPEDMPIIPAELAMAEELDVWEYFLQHKDKIERKRYSAAFSKFDFFYRVTSDALKPNIEKSDILLLRKLNGRKIVNGDCYVIDTKHFGFILRIAYEDDEPGMIRLESTVTRYSTLKVGEGDIFSLYSIVGLMRTQVTAHSFMSVLKDELDKKNKQLDDEIDNNRRLIGIIDKMSGDSVYQKVCK